MQYEWSRVFHMESIFRNILKLSLFFTLSLFVQTGHSAAQSSAPFAYPANAGVLNVKDFGAVGDGITDDTQAFVAALAATADPLEYWHIRIVYVPEGVYRVTDTISKRNPDG